MYIYTKMQNLCGEFDDIIAHYQTWMKIYIKKNINSYEKV